MKKITNIKTWLTISITLLVALHGTVQADGIYDGGTGEPNNPHRISTSHHLNEIGEHPEDWSDCFLLTADINLIDYNAMVFDLIGNDTTEFKGVFDGNNHTISNFSWNSAGTDYVGLFGCVDDSNAEIKDLRLINPDILGDENVGGLVGVLRHGKITRCGIEGGTVSGDLYVGGLAGGNNGTISNCYTTTASVSADYDVGGIAGYNNGDISNCYTAGSVTGTDDYVGGLVGYNDDGTISGCYAVGLVSGTNYVGGFAGHNSGTCSVSFWDTESSGRLNAVGSGGSLGIAGKTTEQMQSMTTFLGWGNETAVWIIDDTNDYPHLALENSPGEPISPVLSDLLEGSGTEQSPYLIRTSNDFDLTGLFSNEWSKHFKLTADIDLSGFSTGEPNLTGCFAGVFDGNGHSISNFTCQSLQDRYIGLFRQLNDPNARIEDLTLIDPNVRGNHYVGPLVGYSRDGTINGCGVEGGTVSGNDAGGLAGRNSSTISNCYADGIITGDGSIGGLAGYNNGAISNCHTAGSVTGADDYVGGLIGNNYYGTISGSYATCTITGDSHVGGLAGYSGYGTISNCYATGSVTGDTRVGGLTGYSSYGTISNCYAAGPVDGNDYIIGGLAGLNNYSDFLDSFWDTQVTDQNDGIGVNYGTGTVDIYGGTTVQMQTKTTYTDQGWDFVDETINGPNDIWRMCADGSNYPKLWWESATGDFTCPEGVDFIDFAVLSLAWLSDDISGNWNSDCDISRPNDGIINKLDLSVFTENWLSGK